MGGGEPNKVKMLCSFGGEFVREQGKPFYLGGKTRLVAIDRSSMNFRSLVSKMSEVCDTDPRSIDVRFQLPEGTLDWRLVSVENDDDVRNMIDEFDPDRKIPIFLFTAAAAQNGVENEEEVDNREDGVDEDNVDALPVLDSIAMDCCIRGSMLLKAEEQLSSQGGPATFSFRRDYQRNLATGPSMSGEMFRRDSQSLVVGQEYEDVQSFRNALTNAAIGGNFELHMIRSDQRRVTARCAAEGCTWRVHASKLPQVNTFRVRTLTAEHTCVRSEDAGHRQATAKWIANCIREKLRHNRNYKPREILNDIHREYGVLITYKRAFLGREKALEELQTEPTGDTVYMMNNYDSVSESNIDPWGEIHDPPRKKRAYGSSEPKDVRPLRCTQCNELGHNRRTCTATQLLQDRSC